MFGEIIEREAARHGIEPKVIAAIIAVESGGDPKARRYEGAFFERYLSWKTKEQLGGKFPKNRSLDTELQDRAYSWGLMQLMGQVCRELGYTGDMVDLLDPEINISLGTEKFYRLLKKNGFDMRASLLDWNGGGNERYPDRVFAAIGGEVAVRILTKAAGAK